MKRIKILRPETLSDFIGGKVVITNPCSNFSGFVSGFNLGSLDGLSVGGTIGLLIDGIKDISHGSALDEEETKEKKLAVLKKQREKNYPMFFEVSTMAMSCKKRFIALWDKRSGEKVIISLPQENGNGNGH